MNQPFINIIIPVKNTEKTITKCLDSILKLDYQNFETVIIDDASTDKTAQILESYRNKIKIIRYNVCLGPSRSRNLASEQAKGEFLAFTDGDCIVAADWLNQLLKGFDQNDVVSAGGSQGMPQDESDFGRLIFEFMKKIGFITDYMHSAKSKIIPVAHNPSCNVMYRKDIFLKMGGFLPDLWPGEDVELDHRLRKAGYRLVFNSKALVYHYRPDNIQKFCRMMFRYGWAQGFLVRKYGIFRFIQLFPFVTLVLLTLFLLGIFYALPLTTILFILILIFACSYFKFSLKLLYLALVCFIYWHLGFYKNLIQTPGNK